MAETGIHKYITPDGGQQPIVHLDMKKLADQIDEDTYVTSSSTVRPPHKPGRRIYDTDTKKSYISDGAIWSQIQAGLIMGHVGCTAGFQTISGSGQAVLFSTAQLLRGGVVFEDSTDSLTVPIAGVYMITVRGFLTGGSGGAGQTGSFDVMSITRNSGIGPALQIYKPNTLDASSVMSFNIPLTAGEKIRLSCSFTSLTWGTDGYNGTYLEVEYRGE